MTDLSSSPSPAYDNNLSFATSIWYLARCIKSLVYLHRDQPIASPKTWLF
ncbi:hypothetical protein [Rhizobium subbaraonis]|nr:hypothetical protein [Rhizobium subbaraonis]